MTKGALHIGYRATTRDPAGNKIARKLERLVGYQPPRRPPGPRPFGRRPVPPMPAPLPWYQRVRWLRVAFCVSCLVWLLVMWRLIARVFYGVLQFLLSALGMV